MITMTEATRHPKTVVAAAGVDRVYADPFPGLPGTDYVWSECGYCTNGVYGGHSGHTWRVNGREDKWCFRCNGAGGSYVLVRSERARYRRYANECAKADALAAQWEANRPVREWLEAEEQWKADVAAWLKEETRRAALVGGFVGEIKERLRKLAVTVELVREFDAYNDFKYCEETRRIVVFATADGRKIKCSGTSAALWKVAEGDSVLLTATVTRHDNYKGQDQTVVNRPIIAPA